MRLTLAALVIAAPVALILSPVFGFTPDAERAVPPDFIVTAAPAYVPLAELRGQERFPKGAQLLLVHAGKAEPLLTGFAATADASVSFDGQTVLFAGKRSAGDPWQIWELALKDRSVRQVMVTATDAERPLYLPGGRLVWAQRTAAGFQMQSGEDGRPTPNFLNPTAGPGILRLAYTRASTFPADVLRDGRILFEAGFPLGSGSTPELYLVYADGSGEESVRCDHGRARWGGTQLASGDVVFTHGSTLARFTSAMAHEVPVQAPRGNYAGAIAETASGAWLMSARTATEARYAIKIWTTGRAGMDTVLAISAEDLVEPVLVAPRARPNRHPSGLHPWDYANLMALDARVSRDGVLRGTPVSVRLEAQDAAGRAIAMGTAPVEQDGSFFVKVPADRPIRFELLDFKGTVLKQEHGWFWARGGEQRICVGCHAGPERASENRVPAVLMRTTVPVDLTGVKAVAGARGGN
ncbi:MAG: hypothetical protein ABSF75_11085 [Terracidiphilus sp.]